jgi:peroxiredoxin Q/BCP
MEKIPAEILNLVLSDTDGNPIKLADFSGKYLVLYFYPKDDTPGCTTEACSFRDANVDIAKLGAAVLGVSKDAVAAHQKFTTKYHLNFPLISDSEAKLAKAFDVWKPKKFMGREFLGVVRTTFIIDPQGAIVKRFDNVKPQGHVEEVLAELRAIKPQ